jgi:hypothetical protein
MTTQLTTNLEPSFAFVFVIHVRDPPHKLCLLVARPELPYSTDGLTDKNRRFPQQLA